MVFFIYQLGSLASVWAISNLNKKRCSSKDQNKIIVLLLVQAGLVFWGIFSF